jgi:predicted dehydrogenase
MATRTIGIVLNGVTGRMGTNQHLIRSILAIIRAGGIRVSDDLVLMPDPVLAGRNPEKLRALSETHGPPLIGKPLPWTTDVEAAVQDERCEVFFDASSTLQRPGFVELAARSGKAVYCEKPTATTLNEALRLVRICNDAGVKHGVVQDKLFLPGFCRLKALRDRGFFGRILSVRGNFGYWVFTGHDPAQAPQRPSWNYRAEDGGGILVDMFCHWRYLIDELIGPLRGVFAVAATDIPERVDETGGVYTCTADDAAYAIFRAGDDVICQFNSSWTTRVRRDDLLTIQVDGTEGSAVAGLRECRTQSRARTPRPVWNPDTPQPIDFLDNWERVDDGVEYDNAFKVQWEAFLRHVALDGPWAHGLLEGAKGVQLAELGRRACETRQWQDVPALD